MSATFVPIFPLKAPQRHRNRRKTQTSTLQNENQTPKSPSASRHSPKPSAQNADRPLWSDARVSVALHGALLRSVFSTAGSLLQSAISLTTLPLTALRRERMDTAMEKAHELADEDSIFIATVPQHIRVHAKIVTHTISTPSAYDVLLLHGAMGSAFCFREMLSPLSTIFRGNVAAFDRPPFGLSETPSYKPTYTLPSDAALTASVARGLRLRSGRIVLMGHSLGGAVALHAAMDDMCEEVAGLVLFAPALTVLYPQAARAATRAMLAVPRVGRMLVRERFRRIAERERRQGRLDDVVREGYMRPLRREHWDEGMREYLREFCGFSVWNSEDRLRDMQIPILIIAAGDDQIVKEHHLERLCRTIPRATLVRLEGVSHLMFEDDPNALCRIVADWARDTLGL